MHYENDQEYQEQVKKSVNHSPRYTLTIKLKDGLLRTIGIIADSMAEAGEVAYFYSKANGNAEVCIEQGFKRPNINTRA